MQVIVLGAGIVGVTTAYFLARQGLKVIVVDAAERVAAVTSDANGGQLSYSFTESLATPGFARTLPALIAGREAGTKLRLSPELLRWGAHFLRACGAERSRRNSLAQLELAAQSCRLMAEVRDEARIEFAFRRAGKLVLLGASDYERAVATTRWKQRHGFSVNVLSKAEAVAVEPALDAFTNDIAGAIYSPGDDVGDARRFATELKRHLENRYGVEFRLNTAAHRLLFERGRVVGVQCAERLLANGVVVCLGAWSNELLADVGMRLPIYPVRGYSVTLPPGDAPPSVSITALSDRFVYSRLDGSVRIAGFADFLGFDERRDAERIAALIETARRIAPAAADYAAIEPRGWGGFRPMTPDGRPLYGATGIPGLYLNTGHGMLGWTLACATAQATASAIAEKAFA